MTLDQLAESLIESLQKQDWPRALVLAWHGFSQNRHRTVEWAEYEWQSHDSDRLEETLLQGVVSADDLARLLTPHPCLLL